MSRVPRPSISQSQPLSEALIQDCFHSYLKSSLTQAKAERLLDEDLLSSAEGDLMITGPALVLYFAALRSTTNPPSVPLPRSTKSSTSNTGRSRTPSPHPAGALPPIDLSSQNCPPKFTSFLRTWSSNVPLIQSLPPDAQHDLARVICGLDPASTSVHPEVGRIALDFRAVAIEISQRRSFQERYAGDLQVALDAGAGPASPDGIAGRKVSFVPPPSYDVASAPPSPSYEESEYHRPWDAPPTPIVSPPTLPPKQPRRGRDRNRDRTLPPLPPSADLLTVPPKHHHHNSNSHTRRRSRSPNSSILTPTSPAIEFIRETLYASLADTLSSHPSLLPLLTSDPSRAYFASLAYALLTVSITDAGRVEGVLGGTLGIEECPQELRKLMKELADIGKYRREEEEEDWREAVERAQRDLSSDSPSEHEHDTETRMERVLRILERGIGWEFDDASYTSRSSRSPLSSEKRRSMEGRALAFANRINALALAFTSLPGFNRQRQDEVFDVLRAVKAGS